MIFFFHLFDPSQHHFLHFKKIVFQSFYLVAAIFKITGSQVWSSIHKIKASSFQPQVLSVALWKMDSKHQWRQPFSCVCMWCVFYMWWCVCSSCRHVWIPVHMRMPSMICMSPPFYLFTYLWQGHSVNQKPRVSTRIAGHWVPRNHQSVLSPLPSTGVIDVMACLAFYMCARESNSGLSTASTPLTQPSPRPSFFIQSFFIIRNYKKAVPPPDQESVDFSHIC